MPSTYDKIEAKTLGSAQAAVTFSVIPATYTDLVLVSLFKNTGGAGNLKIAFNGDTASNYSFTSLYGNGSNAISNRQSNQSAIIFGQADSTQFLLNTLNIFNYANTTTFKTTLSRSSDNGNTYSSTGAIVGLWRKTPEAINSFSITSDSNIAANSTFTL
jgi:hypothetical protein